MHINKLFNLKNKIALVTGGLGNYGKCIVEGLIEAECTVVIASRNNEEIEKAVFDFQMDGFDVYGKSFDQGNYETIDKLRDWLIAEFGGIDIFVNNAVSRPMKSLDDPILNFERSMQVNANGMMYLMREMIKIIENKSGGSIINICSMMGMKGPDLSNYEGTDMGHPPPDYFFHNAGLINLSRYFAKVLVGKNIRVNSISPGGLFNYQNSQFVENYCKKVPLGRMANNDDIKGLIVLLASNAGAYINGENILMDGGLNS